MIFSRCGMQRKKGDKHMKKIAALIVLACIAMMPFAAMAEPVSVTWQEVGEPFVAQYELKGEAVVLKDLGLMIWVPADLVYTETEEEGRYALFIDADQECYLAVDAIATEGMTLDQAYENAVANGMKEPAIVNINGIDALTYANEESNIGQIVLVDTNGNMIIFSFGPIDSEIGQIAYTVIASSLTPME